MHCRVEQSSEQGDANAPAPKPLNVTYRDYDARALVSQAALASEIALAITYNGLSQAVMMVSPGNIEDFIRGFSVTNDIVEDLSEIYDIRLSHFDQACQADVQISSRAFWALKNHRRQMAGTSGCGLCGVEALEQALPQLDILEPVPLPPAEHFSGLRERIEQAQIMARSSGALHAALYFDTHGSALLCREDIGRHNALDKLIGAMQRAQIDARCGFVVVTSRCSLELIHKAVRAKFGTLVSLSAPTALTVQWAIKHRLNLIHVPHRSAPRIYSPT
ncbi:formate dehydrogenase accessory sulfurtransferase FdhD [Pseudomonas sp. 6D_7.1_Bac1]|uniref:formate dehydrogenase accessory sulfurtransferase FdhD n=1 Tax=Pseudomonas sp. 6D_7.1_Bac1 TaxID=2971615 RepID=UPI0021C9A2F3|nr:formate dehydrogenase accessory sulfurtransferase FdhD [Pseudomonas sp. 6D_7.1_Bac1]MCU1752800.1 formate dehydrogenase accessory sulfurtransferase FdhD [Pseudomonas sp. 6D_7.1_Bac1]